MQSEMEKQEEIQLFNRFHAGDEAAGTEIVRRNERLALDYVARITRNGAFRDIHEDLTQAGIEGLLIARDRFEPNPSNEFSTYAFYWVRKSILETIGREKRFRSSHKLLSATNTDVENDEPSLPLEERFGCDDGTTDYECLLSDLEQVLTPFELYICKLIEQGKTMEAIGKSRNVSRQRIHQLLNQARSKIHREIM